MNKIPTSFKIQTTSTQSHKPEETSHTTIFSRGKNSGSKLFLSLKNIFSRADKSSASAAVTKAVPQATIAPIKTENKKSVRFEPDQQTRLRMAYRNFLDPKGAGLGSRGKEQGYEEKVSHFDSAVLKVLNGRELKKEDENVLNEVLPKLKKATEENGQLNGSTREKLLSDFSAIKNKAAELHMSSTLKAAYQGS